MNMYLRGKRLLQDSQQRVGLTTNCNCQTEMFDAGFDVALSQKFFAELNLLKEKPLHGLLIGEIWKLLKSCISNFFQVRYTQG